MKRALKWIAILSGVFLLLIAAAVFSFPYWFGSALEAGGKRFGARFGKYERLDDGRFALTDLVRTNRQFDLSASRVEGYLPYEWYQRARGTTNHTNAFLKLDGWRLVVHPEASSNAPPSSTNAFKSVYGGWQRVEHYLAEMRQWLPKATLLNGVVKFQGREYSFPVITWDNGKLDAAGTWPLTAVPFEIKGKLSGEQPYQLSFIMSPIDLLGRLRATETNGLLNTKLLLVYKENRANLDADFAPAGLLPERATLKAPNLKVPADRLKLDQYNEFTGSLNGEWISNRYTLKLTAHAEPQAGSTAPPADIQLAAQGTTNSVTIEKMRSTAPGLQVSLSDPIELSYRGKLLSDRSELKINADLERLPWLKLKGQVDATLLLKRGEKFPIATIRAAGTNVEAYQMSVPRFQLAGAFDWPEVKDLSLQAQLGTNGRVNLAGGANLETRQLAPTRIEIDAPRGALGTNLLPSNIALSAIKLDAKLSGGITNLAHQATFEIRDFSTPQTQPMQLDGDWKGRQFTFDRVALRARAGPAVLRLQGRGFSEGERTNLVVQEWVLAKGDEPYLKLEAPAAISLQPQGKIEIAPMVLRGAGRSLKLGGTLQWPRAGQLQTDAEKINPELIQYFMQRSLRAFDLERLVIDAGWSNGPVAGKAASRFSIEQERFGRIGAEFAVDFQPRGTEVSQVRLWDRSGGIARARGFLPVTVTPASAARLHFAEGERLEFDLRSMTNQAFWDAIAQMARLKLTNPAVSLVIHGTPAHPTGEFHFTADAIALIQTNRTLPPIGPIDARFALNENVLRIRDFSLQVLGQPVDAKGELVLGTNFWSQRREEVLKYALAHADIQISAPEIKVAPFAAYLPKYLTPQGELSLDLAVKPGRNFDGRMELHGVETRPLPKVGVVESIEGAVNLHGKTVAIEEISGVIGGERMRITGNLDLSPEKVARGYPEVDLKITGHDLPLARNPDVILRSDLNLQVRNGTNGIPVISGDAVLRDSFLLRDVSTLVPGRVAGPARRPPYFSIEQDPFDEWRLNVQVRGDRFMRVRSPFFQGVVSANFRVRGTALEPIALGEASINSGSIIFPFASLEVRQAIVSLTLDDPYLPHIFAVAEGRAFGFDIRMEAEGPANQPVIQFSSLPALSSEQIVLMLTTGQIPRDDFSFSNRDRVSKLAFFLGKSLLQKLRPGKPAEERLTVRSGQDITEQGKQTYEVEYKLSPRWSIVGEYDRFGALNANVKWRLISR